MIKILLSATLSFCICVVIMPLVIKLTKKLKFRQTVLSYVDNHSYKSGTPTMGGIGIMLSVIIPTLVFSDEYRSFAVIALFVTVGYGLVGFVDDFIKIYFKQNKGLTPLQKIIFQTLIAVTVSFYAYYNGKIGDSIFVPFTLTEVSLGVFAVPFFATVFLSLTNAVNLTDGLDGLAARVTSAFLVFFGLIIAIAFFYDGQADGEYFSLLVYIAALFGALAGFSCYNCYPAKIFMGDTGSLALGGGLACVGIFSKLSLYVPIIGIIYVVTALSVIIQVIYFKLTKKRVFLMSPLHHHYERKGVHENRIVTAFTFVTAFFGVISVIITLALK